MNLSLLPGSYAVCRLATDQPIPEWARGAFVSISRTTEELSIVCEEANVPAEVQAEREWSALKVEGPIPFEVVGVAASITTALAQAGISVFFVSTYDTDYVLVKTGALARATDALRGSGHVAGR